MAKKKIWKKCRICRNTKLIKFLDLGSQPLSSVFPAKSHKNPRSSELQLLRCDTNNGCGLVQLKHTADLNEMYGTNYGYYSSLSSSMVNHLKRKILDINGIINLKKNDLVIDIGSNDGLLLNSYGKNLGLKRIGIDPSAKKFLNNYDKDITVILDFFSRKALKKHLHGAKAKVITSIAMFYDIDEPIKFATDIYELLDDNGIWVLELSYLPLFLKQLTYDQACHEHVTYYGLVHIKHLCDITGLKILDVKFNDVNGGSFYLFLSKNKSNLKSNKKNINEILSKEKFLQYGDTYSNFRDRVYSHKSELIAIVNWLKKSKKRIYGYGASTKGNIVLNFCKFSNRDFIAIADKNPEKEGLFTPGSRIPIISHEKFHQSKADIAIVFIWHFRNEVIRDEINFLKRGGVLIFILPRIHFVTYDNYRVYLNKDFSSLSYC